MDLAVRVGMRLRKLRLHRNYTLEAAATDLGVSPSTLSAYELGSRPVTLQRLQHLADYYGVPVVLLIVDGDELPLNNVPGGR